MEQQQPARRKMQSAKTPVSIPDKLYFRIGDVARLCSLPAYVLRFWETEFPQLKPHKGGTGQRLYRKRDVEIVLSIKHLLYDEGFTIAGARRSLVEKRTALFAIDPQPQAGSHPMRRKSDAATKPTQAKVGKAAGIATTGAGHAPDSPKFNELRKEMRALLTILSSEESQGVPPAASIRRKKKSLEISDEPTLF